MFLFFPVLTIFNLLFGLMKSRRFYLGGSLIIQLIYLVLSAALLIFLAIKPEENDQGLAFVFSFLFIFGAFEQFISILANLIWLLKTKWQVEANVRFLRIFHFWANYIFYLLCFFSSSFFTFTGLNLIQIVIPYLVYFGICVWDFFSLKPQAKSSLS